MPWNGKRVWCGLRLIARSFRHSLGGCSRHLLLLDDIIQTGLAELVHKVAFAAVQAGVVRVLRGACARAVATRGEVGSRHRRARLRLRSRYRSAIHTSGSAADTALPRRRNGELVDELFERDPFVVGTARLLARFEIRLALLDEDSLLLAAQAVAQFFLIFVLVMTQTADTDGDGLVLTNDVVGEVVLPHGLQQATTILVLPSDEPEHLEPILLGSVLDAVFHNIAGHLLLGEH